MTFSVGFWCTVIWICWRFRKSHYISDISKSNLWHGVIWAIYVYIYIYIYACDCMSSSAVWIVFTQRVRSFQSQADNSYANSDCICHWSISECATCSRNGRKTWRPTGTKQLRRFDTSLHHLNDMEQIKINEINKINKLITWLIHTKWDRDINRRPPTGRCEQSSGEPHSHIAT